MSKDYIPETTALIEALIAAKCTIHTGSNGGEPDEDFRFAGDIPEFAAELCAADDAKIFLTTPTSKKQIWIYLVLGNDPGELVCDYVVDQTLESILPELAEKWEGTPQRTK